MTLLLGTLDVVDVHVGSIGATKVLLGTVQVWPTGPGVVAGSVGALEAADVAAIVATFTAPAVITGTIAALELADATTIVGTSTPAPITGTIAGVELEDGAELAAVFTGIGVVGGPIDALEADDTSAIAGTSTAPISTGTVAAVEEDDLATVVGTSAAPIYTGIVDAAEDVDTAALAGTFIGLVTGVVAALEADDAAALAGTLEFIGVVAALEEADTAAVTGTNTDPPVTGTIAVTGSGDISTIAGTVSATFPTLAAQNNEVGTSMGAQAINMPTGIAAGNLLVAVAVNDNPSATTMTPSTGWTEVRQQVQGANVIRLAAFARIADGTATDNLTITGASQDYVAWTVRITDHAVTNVNQIYSADATGSTGNGDPPNLAPGEARGWMWLAVEGVDLTTGNTVTSVPSGYTSQFNNVSASSTSSCALAVGSKTGNTTSEDPGTFTNNPTTRPWIAMTIGIPAVAPAPVTGTIAVTELDDTAAITGNDGTVSAFMKYRTFDGSTDLLTFTLGNLASASANPQTLVAVVRLNSFSGDTVLMYATGSPDYSPVDWFRGGGGGNTAFYDGATNVLDGPTWNTGTWHLMAFRSISGSPAKFSQSIYSGSAWPTPTHTTSANTLGARSYNATGGLVMGGIPRMGVDIVCFARFNTALSDAAINAMTGGLAVIQGTSGLTNLWVVGQTTPADTVGTSALTALTGTVLSSGDSPFHT